MVKCVEALVLAYLLVIINGTLTGGVCTTSTENCKYNNPVFFSIFQYGFVIVRAISYRGTCLSDNFGIVNARDRGLLEQREFRTWREDYHQTRLANLESSRYKRHAKWVERSPENRDKNQVPTQLGAFLQIAVHM